MAKDTKRTMKLSSSETTTRSATARRPTQTISRTGKAATDQMIRERAFQIYLARNGGPGDPASDWAQAERELRGQAY